MIKIETIAAINNRRSIRNYSETPIPREDIHTIILAGMQAPSAKNRQPWRFVVVQGAGKLDMLNAMNKGLEQEILSPQLPQSAKYITSVKHTITVMQQAPVTIFIINPFHVMGEFAVNLESQFYETANIQSVGACIQNMILTATDLGYGSLWNCDIFFAYNEISKWLGTNEQIVAAVSFGIPTENPKARPRNNVTNLVEWKI